MNWKQLLEGQVRATYPVTDALMAMVNDDELDWKPANGSNWMTTGQLLHHLTNACGACFKGFVTGDWGLPEGVDPSQIPPEEMLPPAEKLPAVSSVREARDLLEADRKLALEMLERVSEQDLAECPTPAPWDPRDVPLGPRLLQMVSHLDGHKAQLFYYLKLQGRPVHTGHLWGGA